jgi:hypothetical protein
MNNFKEAHTLRSPLITLLRSSANRGRMLPAFVFLISLRKVIFCLCLLQRAAVRASVRIDMFLDLPDPDPDPLVRGMDPGTDPDPDPSIIKQK